MRHLCLPAPHVKPAFRGEFFAFFGHQAAISGLEMFGEGQHGVCNRHFQIQRDAHDLLEKSDIAFLNMTAILTQMHRYRIGARLLREQRGVQRLGIAGLPDLSQGRHMVDIDAKQNVLHGIAASD